MERVAPFNSFNLYFFLNMKSQLVSQDVIVMENPFPSERDEEFMIKLDKWFSVHPIINGTQETVSALLQAGKKPDQSASKLSHVPSEIIKMYFMEVEFLNQGEEGATQEDLRAYQVCNLNICII